MTHGKHRGTARKVRSRSTSAEDVSQETSYSGRCKRDAVLGVYDTPEVPAGIAGVVVKAGGAADMRKEAGPVCAIPTHLVRQHVRHDSHDVRRVSHDTNDAHRRGSVTSGDSEAIFRGARIPRPVR